MPDESAALADPAAEGDSRKVRLNQCDSMANVSPITEYLLPFGSERPAEDDCEEASDQEGAAEGAAVRRVDVEMDQDGAVAGAAEQRDADGAIYFEDGGAPLPLRVLKLPPDVPVPSKDMIRRHKAAGHCPYMPWCSHCVMGACNAPAHVARPDAPDSGVPEVHCDYAFFKDKKGCSDGKVTVLVVKDRQSGGFCADVVPRKGTGGGYAVKQTNRNLKKFGHHHKFLIRSDGESAIVDLLNRVSEMRASQTILEQTPVWDSRANGMAERAVQSVEKAIRVLNLGTEEVLGSFSFVASLFYMVSYACGGLPY